MKEYKVEMVDTSPSGIRVQKLLENLLNNMSKDGWLFKAMSHDATGMRAFIIFEKDKTED